MARIPRIFALMIGVSFAYASAAQADEGMWTFDNFPSAKMRAKYGWAPDKAWLDHARLSSIRLAQGCSASFISPDGLVMTNHHCARDCIEGVSDAAHDYVAHGFYAATLADEKSCPQLEANQLIGIKDVTATVSGATKGLSGKAFAEAERGAKAKLEGACATSADLRCQVVTLYQGGVYDLYTYRRYQDLRLVWAVEDAAANFGGDPDNFNFPRFAIDAAFVRVYDHGKPLHTDNFLHFAKNGGVKEGDVVFTSGNPGSTARQYTVSQLVLQRDLILPTIVDLLSEERGMLHQFGSEGAEQQRNSLNDLFFTENSVKALKGEEKALVDGSLMADKQAAETALRHRVAADPKLAAQVGGAWDAIAKASATAKTIYPRYALEETLARRLGSQTLGNAVALVRYAVESGKPDAQRLDDYTASNFPALKQTITSTTPVYAPLDKVKLAWWLTKLREYLGPDDPDVHSILGTQSPEQIAAEIVDGSKLGDPAVRAQLLAGGAAAINASSDPMLVFARRLDGPARKIRAEYENDVKAVFTKNAALIAQANFALQGTSVYPDATFTLRISYGTVKGYEQDGRHIAPFTDFAGAFARETGSDPFKLPESWTNAKGTLNLATKLDVASTDDIIGGNSGSPLIDRNGDVAGLVFDGNIQSLGGDFGYDGSVNRTVAVDITAIQAGLATIYHADRIAKEVAQ